uniref:30S ribosomal protein S15 n=1 Tax=Haemonchus contortus TaxID=6289 RepID=A0A7I4YF80_HAECO
MDAPRIRFPFRVGEVIESARNFFNDLTEPFDDELEDEVTREKMMSRILNLALQKKRGQSRRKKGYNLRKDILQIRLIRFLSGDIRKTLMIREKRRSRAEGYLKGL